MARDEGMEQANWTDAGADGVVLDMFPQETSAGRVVLSGLGEDQLEWVIMADGRVADAMAERQSSRRAMAALRSASAAAISELSFSGVNQVTALLRSYSAGQATAAMTLNAAAAGNSAALSSLTAPGVKSNAVVMPDDYDSEGRDDNWWTRATDLYVSELGQEHTIHVGGDIDWVKFTPDTIGRYSIQTTGTLSDMQFTVYSLTGAGELNEIATVKGDKLGGPEYSEFLRAGVTYYIKVSALDPDKTVKNYQIRVSASDGAYDQYEVGGGDGKAKGNDNLWTQATALSVGEVQLHSIHLNGDIDWVKIAANGLQTIGLDASDDMKLTFYELTKSGLVEISRLAGNHGGIAYEFSSAKTYYVSAEKNGSGTVQAYELSLVNGNPGYIRVDQYENDNTKEQATTLTVKESQQHTLHDSGDVDWMTFSLTDTGYGEITLSATERLAAKLYQVVDGNLMEVSSQTGTNITITTEAAPGTTYYLQTETVDGTPVNSYDVNLSVTPPSQNYVVLFSGGGTVANNSSTYYETVKAMYEVCINVYNIPAENIYVIFADGTDPAPDQNNVFTGAISSSDMSYATSRGSKVYAATRSNTQAVFDEIAGKVTANDHFLLYTDDHGSGSNDPNEHGEEVLCGWYYPDADDRPTVYNDISGEDLAQWTSKISSAVAYATYLFTECFSGGMLEALPDQDNVFGTAAANHFESSWGGWGYDGTSEISGYRGFAIEVVRALAAGYTNTYDLFNRVYSQDIYACHNPYDPNGVCAEGHGAEDAFEHPWMSGGNYEIFART